MSMKSWIIKVAFVIFLSEFSQNHGFQISSRSHWTNRQNQVDINSAGMSLNKKTAPMTTLRSGSSENESEDSVWSKRKQFFREMLAEAIGTGLIVHLGCGTVCAALYKSAQVGLYQIAAVWAIAVSVAIYCTANLSGAHLNPAITLAFAIFRDFPSTKIAGYWVAQVFGAFFGGLLNYVLYATSITAFEAGKGIIRGTPDSYMSAAGAFGEYFTGSGISLTTAFIAEAVGTGVLAFVIFSLTNKNNKDATPKGAEPAVIGCTVAALISVIAPLTQAGFNPARDFGPRMVTAIMGWGMKVSYLNWWVYVLGPIIGAIVGAFVADKILWIKKQ